MAKATCTKRGCREKHWARGLCQRHYNSAYRRGELPTKQLVLGVHYLSNVDREAQTADCAVCGTQVPIRVRVRRGSGRIECECMTNVTRNRAVSRTRERPEGRKKRLRIKYNITPGDYDRMYAGQLGRCAICHAAHPQLHVDHDHATGKVRALLCRNCNIALGYLRDDVDLLYSAAQYLRIHSLSAS